MSTLRFVLAMAWREGRAARRRLLLLTASITVGVAALVALDSFTTNLRATARSQARALLGADLAVSGREPLTRETRSLLDSLVGCPAGRPCADHAQVTSFSAMAYVPRTEGARLVQVAAVEGGYPFYGAIRTDPDTAWRTLQSSRQVLVDPSLLTGLGAQVGDSLALGEVRFRISGVIEDVPGDVGVRTIFGPRVFIPGRYLDQTGLLVPGSRAEYESYLRLPGGDAQALAAQLRPRLSGERLRVRTVADDERNMDEALEQLGRYLGLVALVALLLGGLGVASAVHVFIRQKLDTIAILRCLGSGSGRLFAVYLLQAGLMGLLGSVLGAGLGIVLQVVLPGIFADFLPVDVSFSVAWGSVLTGIAVGLLVSLLFSLLPLLGIRRVSPLVVLRRPYETVRRPRDPWRIPLYILLVAGIAALASWQTGNLATGLAFTLGIGVVLLVLTLAAFALTQSLRRWFPRWLPYLWRQGLANLYRPANQTLTVVLSLGFAAFLLSTLYLVQANLLREFRFGTGGPRPNLVFFDIQPTQRDSVERIIRSNGFPLQPAVPIVPMRLLSVKGRPVSEILRDPDPVDENGEPLGRWAFRREYRSTYRDTAVASERTLVGSWWMPGTADTGVMPVSMEVEVAGELGVTLGDTIVWDVQGVPMTTRIANLREVDWARFEPNFFVVFPEGPLRGAPQMFVLLTRVPDPAGIGRLQRQVIQAWPNVTALDLTQLQASLESLIDKVVLVVRFMALFSLATGAVVLVGAVATSRWQRLREAVLLKTLGASRRQVLRILAVEYLCLGLLALVTALLLSGGAGWLIMRLVFDQTFAVPLAPLLWLGAGILGLTLAVGLANSSDIFRRAPLEVLRAE